MLYLICHSKILVCFSLVICIIFATALEMIQCVRDLHAYVILVKKSHDNLQMPK